MSTQEVQYARCPICGLDVQLEGAPHGGRKTNIVCPNCGTPFSHSDPTMRLEAQQVTLLLDHYQITGTVYLSPEFNRFSDAWESLIDGQRSFIPVTEVEVRRPNDDVVAQARFMQVQKSEIRGAVPASEEF